MNSIINRNSTADILKGLAVLLMIQVHIFELFAEKEVFDSFAGKISLFLGGIPAAPVFMGVMGYFLAESKRSTSELIKRGVFLFMGGMLLNIGINVNLFFHIFYGKFDLNPINYLFSVDILHLAGLSIIVIALIKDSLKEHYLISFFLALLFSYLSGIFGSIIAGESVVLRYLTPYIWGSSEWSFFPLLPWISYPLFGFSLRVYNKQNTLQIPLTAHFIILCSLAWILFIYITYNYGAGISFDLQSYYHHSILFTLWTITALTGYIFIWHFLCKKLQENIVFYYLRWVGKNVTVMYVFQWLIIGNIATLIYRTQSLMESIIWFLGITVVASLLSFYLNKLRTKTSLI